MLCFEIILTLCKDAIGYSWKQWEAGSKCQNELEFATSWDIDFMVYFWLI